VSAGIRRWIFNALGVLALCLLMTGLDARAGDLQAVRVSFSPEFPSGTLLERHRDRVLSMP
jgi:hypothetical protein